MSEPVDEQPLPKDQPFPKADYDCPEQQAVGLRAQQVVSLLEAEGYGLIILTIVKIAAERDWVSAPGVTLLVAKPNIEPILPSHAKTLRTIADELDAAFRKAGVEAADSSTTELDNTVVDSFADWAKRGPQ